MTEKVPLGRLALRREGELWNAYYALPDTMEGAVFLGSVPVGVADNPKLREGFLDLMRLFVSEFLQDTLGQEPTWSSEQKAPEHERSGHS